LDKTKESEKLSWQIASVLTILGTAFAFLYLSISLPEEQRNFKFYIFREWTRIGLLIISFLLILTNFWVTYEIANPESTAVGSLLEKWYIYAVIFVVLLVMYFLIRAIIETVRAPAIAFGEINKGAKDYNLNQKYQKGRYNK